MSTREERATEAREEARSAAHCLGCALGISHTTCDWEQPDHD